MSIRRVAYELNQSPLYSLRRKARLAELLNVSLADLRRLAKNCDSLYSQFSVPKKNGGVREVENPRRQLKLVQARIARLLCRIAPPDYLFCPVKGRCYVSNAARHHGQRVIHCLDIRKYFPSTPSWRVYWFFRSVMKCENDIAEILAKIACFKGHLPTGSPLSPIMSYYAYYDVWQGIAAICNAHGYRLSVYIDDVTISGSSISSTILWSIKKVIHRSGLRYHKEKHYIDQPAEITGVIVGGADMVAPNRQFKKLVEIRRALLKELDSKERQVMLDRYVGLQGQLSQIGRLNGPSIAK